MSNNGTDRDIALLLVDAVDDCLSMVTAINNTLYHAAITTQPTDQTAAISSSAVFSVVASNVAAYQWEYRQTAEGNWLNVANTGNKTDTVTIGVSNSNFYNYSFRCKITGKDGAVIYTDVVKILEPEPEPGT